MRLNVPLTGEEELAEVAAVLESGYLTQGPRAARLEELIADYVGSDFAFAVSSATTGLHLALAGIGVKPGDEVVVPDFSFPATANAVIQQGAIPVFVDIELDTFNLDPTKLEAAAHRSHDRDHARARVRAHRGHGSDQRDRGCARSARDRRRRLRALRDLQRPRGGNASARPVCSPFHPRKIITTGEGGMITTDDETLAQTIRVLRTHGAVRGDLFMSFIDAGYNYRLSDLHAAVGIAQMAKLDAIVDARQALAHGLTERVSHIPGVSAPTVPEGSRHSFQSFVVLLDEDIDRDQVIRLMKARDIETTLGTYSMHLQPYFRDRFAIPDEALPNATRAHNSALTLPLYPQLDDGDLDRIAAALAESVELARR